MHQKLWDFRGYFP
jgi:hypothetical protein